MEEQLIAHWWWKIYPFGFVFGRC